MTPHNKKVTIIITTFNGRHYLPDCLGSLAKQNYPENLVKVIIIDNHSTDSTVEYIRAAWPKVKLIVNGHNFGFAGANNQGYFLAQKAKSDYLVLLNQDTIVEPNWLKRLVNVSQEHKGAAIVQPKLMLYPQKDLINSLGNSIHFLGFAYCNHYKEKDQFNLTDPFEAPYASGGACLIKLSTLRETGLFDDALFAYHEDVDLGWRLRLAGYKILVDPLAIVYHKYHYSKAKYKFYYMERNRLMVSLENYRLLTLLIFLPAFLIMELGIIFFSLKNGWFKEKIKGYFWLVVHLPRIFYRRLETQFKVRRVKDSEIIKLFTASIKFQEINNPLLVYIVNPLMELYFYLAKKIVFW